MKRVVGVLLVVALLLGSGSAAARPDGCVVVIDGATRDAAVASLQALMGASLRLGDWMVDLGTLQEAGRVVEALETARSFGCAEADAR